ncbi:NADP-dependent oxidoreductase [Maritimibacter sp. 55A14]|nr:NADP-dependent oxidoreductase [Maritimibacter sp. 55A14]
MPGLENRRVILAARPKGVPGPEHFAVEDGPVPVPGPGQVLVRTAFWSVDPAMRGWVNDVPNYIPPVEIGAVMRSFAVGRVVASRHPGFAEGEIVTGLFGWQRYALVEGATIDRKVVETDLPQSLALGLLGLNGVTAYLGLTRVGAPEPGQMVLVSTAAGAVGSAVGQIAKLLGCRTVGVAGGPEKTALCRDVFGYDAAIDYKAGGLDAALAAACPDGWNVYFDNTCGPVSDAALHRMATGARWIICGTAAVTDWDPWPDGPRVHRALLVKRARMEGFLVLDHKDAYADAIARLAGWVRDGRIVWREHILDGAEAARDAIGMLYRGENTGKLLVRVD